MCRERIVSHGAVLARAELFSQRLPQLSIGYAQDMLYDREIHGVRWDPEMTADDSGNEDTQALIKRAFSSIEGSKTHRVNRAPPGSTRVFTDAHDGEDIVANRIYWAISRNTPIGHTVIDILRGERCLYPVDADCITVSEPLYISRVDSESGAAIDDRENGTPALHADSQSLTMYKDLQSRRAQM